MSKGELWSQFERLDLQVYQKPLSTFAYIPFSSDHAPHIRRAWIRGELLRYAKRSNSPLAFAEVRLQFARRLLSRGYPPDFLQTLFDAVTYDDRWQQLLVKAKAKPSNMIDPQQSSVVCALTLPYTQRLDALEVPSALFSSSQRWLLENDTVPLEVRELKFLLAQRTVGKLSAAILQYQF
eukprot:SAG31_NODE_106_length_24954_cov_17.726413_22_plen_180_part_00